MELKHGLDSSTEACTCEPSSRSKPHIWTRASHSSPPHTGFQSPSKLIYTFLCAPGYLGTQRLSISMLTIWLLTTFCQWSAATEIPVFKRPLHTSSWLDFTRVHVCLLCQVFTKPLFFGLVCTKDLPATLVSWAWAKNCYNSRHNIQKIVLGSLNHISSQRRDDRIVRCPYLDEVFLRTSVKPIKLLPLTSVKAKFISAASALEHKVWLLNLHNT